MGRKRRRSEDDLGTTYATRTLLDPELLDGTDDSDSDLDDDELTTHPGGVKDIFSRMVESNSGPHREPHFNERHFASRKRPTVVPPTNDEGRALAGTETSLRKDWAVFSGDIDMGGSLEGGMDDKVDEDEEEEEENPEFDLVGEVLAGEFSRTFSLDDLERRDGDGSDEEDPDVIQVEAPKKTSMLEEFRPLREEILDILLSLDRSLDADLVCIECNAHNARYRCTSCSCDRRYCQKCILAVHTISPFHFIEYWNDRFWVKTTLDSRGFVMHLGHRGKPCPRAVNSSGGRMHILHTTGMHRIRVVFCACPPGFGHTPSANNEHNQLLRARLFPATIKQPTTAVSFCCLNKFHLLTTQGKLTGMDYYETLVHLTDNLGIDPPNKRYDEFMRIARLWRHLKMLKRAAVHLTGLNNAEPGSCAVGCYACPSATDFLADSLFNAPWGDPDWVDTLFAQLDANFRLKNKDRDLKDKALNGGLSSIVNEEQYKAHLSTQGEQVEVNICDSSLHAVDHANLRGSAAYIASGVGACQCRHMLVRPGGVGDLQKGERYSNMDYILASACRGCTAKRIVISYDIACQWYINFKSRCTNLPPHLGFDYNNFFFEYVIPKFHIAAHGVKCQCRFSLNFRRYMGRTDGENIERGWAWMNPASLSTRKMGPGARHDTLDDQWCAWNFRLLTRFGVTLFRRLDEAVLQARLQRRTHEEFSATFSADVVQAWAEMVDTWSTAVSYNENVPDPFREPEPDVTFTDVRRQLNAEELEELNRGVVPKHSISASKYIATGLQLEDQQRVLKATGKSQRAKRTLRGLESEDKEVELCRKIVQWQRDVQSVYMPALDTGDVGLDADADSEVGAEDCEVWDMPLHLPSEFERDERERLCSVDLVNKELRLRLAQADDSLDELRKALRTVTTLAKHQHMHTAGTGVAANTRMQSLISKHQAKVDRLADRYRAARAAVMKLDSEGRHGGWKTWLKELKKEHVKPPTTTYGPGQGKEVISWIWRIGTEDGEGSHDESLRVEWAKLQARAERWEEEVILVPIEMRRVLRNLVWKARWWREEAASKTCRSDRIRAGILAYSEKQAFYLEELAGEFSSQWLSLFREHHLDTPTGWPHACSTIRVSARKIIRRRDRMKLRRLALQREEGGEHSDRL